MSNNYVEEKFLIKLADTFSSYDCSNLENMLADDMIYGSVWFPKKIKSKAKYLEYLEHKLMTMKKHNKKTNYVMMYQVGSGQPVLMFDTRVKKDDFWSFIAEANLQGFITAVQIIPSYYLNPLVYKDKNAFDEFMKEANKC